MLRAEDALCVGLCDDFDATICKRLLQKVSRSRVELAFHDGRHEMQNRHRHAALFQAVGGFEAKKTAADDNGMALAARDLEHLGNIIEITIGQHFRQTMARYRDDDRMRAGRNHQLVIGSADAILGCDGFRCPVDVADLRALVKRNAVIGVPFIVVDDDVFIGLLAGQHRREHDAVVIDARFRVEDRDFVKSRRAVKQFFEHPPRSHAIADDDEFLSHGDHSAATMGLLDFCRAMRAARFSRIAASCSSCGFAPPS